jgi:hypothetical protein
MKDREESELCVVTEIGVFGELDIKDPTKKKVKKKSSEMEALIEAAIEENKKNLIKED